jgi:purine-binding chemotaxis protein CheW
VLAPRYLLCRAEGVFLAIPVEQVHEIMRPLDLVLAGGPAFLLGVAIVRGEPTPVLDAGALLGAPESSAPARFVTIRGTERTVAIAVQEVVGVVETSGDSFRSAPLLLASAESDAVQALGALDGSLMVLLNAVRALPDETWQELTKRLREQ